MNKKIILSLSVIGIAAAIAIGGTFAYFSSTQTSTGNTFTAGTLALDGPGITNFVLGNINKMAPGDITGTATIIIKNTGTIPLAWFGNLVMNGATDEKLYDALYIDYAQMEFLDMYGTPNAAGWPEPTDNFITAGIGSGSYPGWYNTLAGQGKFNVISLRAFDGNNGMGSTPYEFMGALKPGYAYRLTLRFGFATGAGNEYQGSSASPITVSFKADATQVNAGALEALHTTFSNHLNWMNTQLSNQATP